MLSAYCFALFLLFHLMHCIMLTLAHMQPFYALDQDYTEPKLEESIERAQVEAITNIILDQGKSRCITLNP
jgi:hypothetical protein